MQSTKTLIEEKLNKHLGIADLDEIFINDLNVWFPQLYKVIAMLGVGAFGIVLEVQNLETLENSALKVTRLECDMEIFRSLAGRISRNF